MNNKSRLQQITEDTIIKNSMCYLDMSYDDIIADCEINAKYGKFKTFIAKFETNGIAPDIYNRLIDEGFEIETDPQSDIIQISWK